MGKWWVVRGVQSVGGEGQLHTHIWFLVEIWSLVVVELRAQVMPERPPLLAVAASKVEHAHDVLVTGCHVVDHLRHTQNTAELPDMRGGARGWDGMVCAAHDRAHGVLQVHA